MTRRLTWERDGRDWPNREFSRFVVADGLRWHVQQMGAGPVVLLMHGTGASTHSWRALAPLLAQDYTIFAADLPGHGFTDAPTDQRLYSLSGMASGLSALLRECRVVPDYGVGHSAGAAILARMCLDGAIKPRMIVGLNAALLPLSGVAGSLFSPIARVLSITSLAPRLFAWAARDRAAVERLIAGTGSRLDPFGTDLYWRLISNPGHATAALQMMANWDLPSLQRDLPRLRTPLTLLIGSTDRTVPPDEAGRVARLLPSVTLRTMAGLGHLAHEEQPRRVLEELLALFASTGQAAAMST
jgi:magnesium chelatase accessory protein